MASALQTSSEQERKRRGARCLAHWDQEGRAEGEIVTSGRNCSPSGRLFASGRRHSQAQATRGQKANGLRPPPSRCCLCAPLADTRRPSQRGDNKARSVARSALAASRAARRNHLDDKGRAAASGALSHTRTLAHSQAGRREAKGEKSKAAGGQQKAPPESEYIKWLPLGHFCAHLRPITTHSGPRGTSECASSTARCLRPAGPPPARPHTVCGRLLVRDFWCATAKLRPLSCHCLAPAA